MRRLQALLPDNASSGIRVNPERSFVQDDRYDPCRKYSKLGVALDQLASALARRLAAGADRRPTFHTVFAAKSFSPLRQTVALVEKSLPGYCPN